MIKFKFFISVLFLTLLFSCGNSKGDRKFISDQDTTKNGDGSFKGDRKFISVQDSTEDKEVIKISDKDSVEKVTPTTKIITSKPYTSPPSKSLPSTPTLPIPDTLEYSEKPEISENPLKIDTQLSPIIPIAAEFSHSNFNSLLGKYVSASGKVDYKGFQQVEKELDKYLEQLSENTPQSSWGKNKKLAYWLNAYNAFTIKKILVNYPIKSIMDLSNGKVWDEVWIKLSDETYSLNQIEHEIIRPTFQDARIHFAVNCAAKSCPPLSNGAFTETNVQQKLEGLAKSFVNNSSYNSISTDQASVSKIFDWYKADFGDVIEYLNSFSSTKLSSDSNIAFKEYDWSLND